MILVVGPKELPHMLRTFGKTIGGLRRMASEFQGQFNDALREAERQSGLDEAKKSVGDLNPMGDLKKSVGSVNEIGKDIDRELKAKPAAGAGHGVEAKPAAAAEPKPSAGEPEAVSQSEAPTAADPAPREADRT